MVYTSRTFKRLSTFLASNFQCHCKMTVQKLAQVEWFIICSPFFLKYPKYLFYAHFLIIKKHRSDAQQQILFMRAPMSAEQIVSTCNPALTVDLLYSRDVHWCFFSISLEFVVSHFRLCCRFFFTFDVRKCVCVRVLVHHCYFFHSLSLCVSSICEYFCVN